MLQYRSSCLICTESVVTGYEQDYVNGRCFICITVLGCRQYSISILNHKIILINSTIYSWHLLSNEHYNMGSNNCDLYD